MSEVLGIKSLIFTTMQHITLPEMAIFSLFFLVFVFIFFISVIFWRYHIIFAVCFVIEGAVLFYTPFGIAFIMRTFLYPIEIRQDRFSPFVYTSGFSFDVEIRNMGKIAIKECMLTIIPLRQNPKQSKIITLKDTLLPLAGYTTAIKTYIPSGKTYRWSGIIDKYRHSGNYKTLLDCH